MPKPSTEEVIKKADITVADLVNDGGYLNPMQSSRFIQLVQDQPTVLKDARRVTMTAPIMNIDKIGFESRMLQAAPSSGIALAASQRSKPTTGQVVLTTKEVIAEVHIPYDLLEDNIERGNLENSIMTMMAERAAIDLEELILLGDTASTDAYLALHNGVLKLVSTNVSNLTGTSTMSKNVFKTLIKAMPPKYKRQPSALRFYCSHNNETEYRDSLADRQTSLGDDNVTGRNAAYAYGVPIIPAALMPEAKFLLTNPKNLIWGVQRDIMVETDKDIRARTYIIVMTLRAAIQIEEEKACVLGENFG